MKFLYFILYNLWDIILLLIATVLIIVATIKFIQVPTTFILWIMIITLCTLSIINTIIDIKNRQ